MKECPICHAMNGDVSQTCYNCHSSLNLSAKDEEEQIDNENYENENNSDIRYQHRSNSLSNREILANALESTAKTGEELSRLRAYKEASKSIDEDAEQLVEIKKKIKEISFTKGSDRTQLVKLNNSKKILEDRILRKDKALLKLESMEAIQNILAVENKRLVEKWKAEAAAKGEKIRAEMAAKFEEERRKDIEKMQKMREAKKTSDHSVYNSNKKCIRCHEANNNLSKNGFCPSCESTWICIKLLAVVLTSAIPLCILFSTFTHSESREFAFWGLVIWGILYFICRQIFLSLFEKSGKKKQKTKNKEKNSTNKYCKQCGGLIDNKTKKCTSCNKQYFYPIRHLYNIKNKIESKQSKYCKKCGGAIDENRRKCNNCGKKYFKFRINKKTVIITISVIVTALIVLFFTTFKFHSDDIVIISSSTLFRDSTAYTTIYAEPHTEYYLTVTYSDGSKETFGAAQRETDYTGRTTWQWYISIDTSPGECEIRIESDKEYNTETMYIY